MVVGGEGAKCASSPLDDESASGSTRVVLDDELDKGGTYVINDAGLVVHNDGRLIDRLHYRRHWHRRPGQAQASASGDQIEGDAPVPDRQGGPERQAEGSQSHPPLVLAPSGARNPAAAGSHCLVSENGP